VAGSVYIILGPVLRPFATILLLYWVSKHFWHRYQTGSCYFGLFTFVLFLLTV